MKLIFLAAISLALVAQQAVSPVGFSESTLSVSAFGPKGAIPLPVARLQVDSQASDGKTQRGNLIVVFDPQTGHYLWRYAEERPGDTRLLGVLESGAESLYAEREALVDFYMPSALYIYNHVDHADSLDAARQFALDRIQQATSAAEKAGYHLDAKEVNVIKEVGMAFACPPGPSAYCGFSAKIVSVARDGDNWRLVLRNRWDQELVLDSKFNFVSTRRLPDTEKK